MNKRIAIISLTILLSGVAVLGYFLHQGRKNLFTDPFRAIAPEACVVIETIDLRSFLNSLTTGKGLFAGIGKIKEFNSFSTKLKYIADQVNKPGFKKFMQEGTAVIAFYPSEDGSPEPFISAAVPAGISYRQMREALEASGVKNITERKEGGKRLAEVPFAIEGKADTLFLSYSSGLVICTTSGKLIGQALLQEQSGTDIRNTPGFSRILLSSGKNEDKIYVLFENLKQVIKPLLTPAASSIASKIAKLGECSGGDIYISDDGISVSGYTECSDPSFHLYRFRDLVPEEFGTYKVLPASTAMFESVVLDGTLSGGGSGSSREISSMAAQLIPYLGGEATRAYTDNSARSVNENTLIIYNLKNRARCEQIFRDNLGRQAPVSYFQPDDQTRIPVYNTDKISLASAVVPGFAQRFTDSYYTFYDNYLVSGNSYATVSDFLYDNLLHKTLSNDILYREFERTMTSRAGYLFFCVPSHIIDYLEGYLNNDIIKGLRSNKPSLDKLQSVGFQLSSINGMIYNSLSVSYKDIVREKSPTEWETLLDTTAAIKPFFFTNHITGAREIFIQDMKNNAYLINAAGRVLWKVPLKERITGTIYMIDYYRNGKYQLLFSGRNELHILDRNGNYVERYPVKLRSPATNSLALFDYDNNKTYRLIIAGEDKLVYAYDKSGSVVKGWKPFRTAGFVRDEAGFYKVSGKDFIVVSDESSLYFLDRYGNVRLTPNDAVTRAKGSALRFAPGSKPYLVCSAPNGTVQNIYFDGDVKKFTLKEFSVDHSFDFFDVDGDGFGEYIFIDKGTLYLYDHDRKEMFTREFDSEELGEPISFIFSSSDRKIGVFDADKKLIYLIDKKGEVMKGFPLRGASMFSIGRISPGNDWNLIVGGSDRFLYNYKLANAVK